MTRNTLIAEQQGNVNPFISDHTLVHRAFFEADASYSEGDPNCFSFSTSVEDLTKENWAELASNIINHEMVIFSTQNNGTVILYDLQGRIMAETQLLNETRMNVDSLISGVYVVHISDTRGAQKVFRIFVK